jgi:preprotein translocase subunit SecE
MRRAGAGRKPARQGGGKAGAMSVLVKAREFLKEVQVESTKVSWPTRNELRDSTIVVIVTVLIVSIFIGVVDRLLSFGIGSLFRLIR